MSNNLGGFAISEEIYKWILENIPEGSTILELGSGTGTLELTKKYKVFSIEDDKKWVGLAKDSTYLHAPINSYDGYCWYNKELVSEFVKDINYDLLLVDAPVGAKCGRWGFVENIDMFNLNVPVIIDDSHRKDEEKIVNWLNKNYKINEQIDVVSNEKKSTVLIIKN